MVVAWAAVWCTVPSAVWRVAMIAGLVPGTADLRAFELAGNPALGYAYVIGLSVVQLGAGLLTLGLIRPWGERIAGWRVPVWFAVTVATLGGLAVVYLFDIALLGALLAGRRPDAGLVHGIPLAIMVACYIPIFFWGPLELAATAGYARRRGMGRGRVGVEAAHAA